MKKTARCFFFLLLAVLFGAVTPVPRTFSEDFRKGDSDEFRDNFNEDLREGFRNPPESAKPCVWWHWNDDRINKTAMTADLESMKEAGLGGAYIFFLCGPGEGIGMTPERADLYRHAAQEAKRLGLSLGMRNCPGWSSSGGAWVKPEKIP